MAELKGYSISTDITSGAVDTPSLHSEIDKGNSVSVFDGIFTSGDLLCVCGDSILDEAGLDKTITDHTGLPEPDVLMSDVRRMTTDERLSYSKVEGGATVFDTDLESLYTFDGTYWLAK